LVAKHVHGREKTFMATRYWLVKQEPKTYPWSQLMADGKTIWSGVRNYQARNYLRAMSLKDQILYYHSVSQKSVMGVASVAREHYPDPTDDTGKWSAVDIVAVRALKTPVSLEAIKADPQLSHIPLLRQSRLSVMPLEKEAFERILAISQPK